MFTPARLRGLLCRTAPIALVALFAAGCGTLTNPPKATPATSAANPSATNPSTAKPSTAGSAGTTGSSTEGMSGMDMGATPAVTGSAAASADAAASGVQAVPTQVLGTAIWQGMKVTADAMTPVPFLVYNGTSMREVNPPRNTSFHLMVLLNDAQTNVVIPYASVWGTITQGGKTPFDESLWPMISRYMGPHYGNDVALPGAGSYQLKLLISPPVSARHLEYQGVWLKPHTVTFTFRWQPPA
jgi:hypothetical protein